MPVCDTGLFAIDHAQTRSKKAYDVTGVVAVQCNHALVRKNGMANLQKGERSACFPAGFNQPAHYP